MKARPSRHDIEKALRDWRLLYRKPPPEKEKPADLEKGGPEEKNTRISKSKDTLSSVDLQREAQARAAYLRYCLANDLDAKRRHLARMNRHIQARSPEMIYHIEQMRGLR